MLALFSGPPGIGEVLVVLVIALILFGNKLPQVARSLGKGLFEFKKGVRGFSDEFKQAEDADKAETKPLDVPAESKAEETADSASEEKKD